MSEGVARKRLMAERKNWRKDRPFGFVARPQTKPDGSTDMMNWDCKIPGTRGTPGEGGLYTLTLQFTEDYPGKPPIAKFDKDFFHPNVYPSGKVCLSILNEEAGWRPSITVKQILTGIQDLLNDPNDADPAQERAFYIYREDRNRYEALVKQQARRYHDTS
ncbi:unnamed protein product [Pedinophyceae sp. YPF-701]|nr:unnamed protein product [Pedinophyceae sp. YPF-701]